MFVANNRDPNGREKALRQAQANADRTGKVWMVFSDTSGNWHAAPHSDKAFHPLETVVPNKKP